MRSDLNQDNDKRKKKSKDSCMGYTPSFIESIVRSCEDAIIGKKPDGTIVSWNKGAENIYGYPAKDIVGRHISLLSPFDLKEEAAKIFKIVQKGDMIKDYETVRIRKDGRRIDVALTISPVYSEDGAIIGISTISRDISERKKVERELLSRFEFEKLIMSLSTHFINLTPDELDSELCKALEVIAVFSHVDRSYIFLFYDSLSTMDCTHEWCVEGIPAQIQDLQDIEVDNRFPYFSEVLKNLDVFHVPSVVDLPDNAEKEKEIFLEGKIQSLINVPMVYKKRLIGFIGFDSVREKKTWTDDDISLLRIVGEIFASAIERKRAEELISINQAELHAFVDELPGYAFIKDKNGRLLMANKKLCNILNLSRAEITGKSNSELFPPDLAEKYSIDDIKVLETGQPLFTEESVEVKGERITIATRKIPLKDGKGDVTGIIGLGFDITELKKAEESLKESESRFRQLAETIKEVFWMVSPDWKEIIYISPTYEEMWGLSCESLYKDPLSWSYSIEPEDKVKVISDINDKIKGDWSGKSYPEYRIKRPDGSIRWILARSFPVKNEAGDIYRVAGIAEDITGRKKAEETLTESRRLLQLVMDNIPQAIFWKDFNSVYLGCNAVFARFAGVETPENIAGKTDYDFAWTKDQAEAFRRDDRQVMDTDKALYHIIEPQLQANGKQAWLDTNKIPMHDKEGNVIGILGTYEDITERKRMEEALKESEASLALAQKNAQVGTWWLDLSDNKLYWTDECYNIFGVNKKDYSPNYELFLYTILPEDRPRIESAVKAAIELGIHYKEDFRIYRPNGDMRYINCEGDTILKNNIPVRMLGVCFDITDRKIAEEALKKSKQETELYVDLMGHDINNMNQITMGFLELAQNIIQYEGKLDTGNVYLLEKAIESLKNSSQLIDNVRKLQMEKMGLYEPEVIDVNTVLADVIVNFMDIPGRHVTINYTSVIGYYVKANTLLKDLFINIVGNALKHSTGDLTIDIVLDMLIQNGVKYFSVSIDDNGPGIPDNLKKNLLDRLNLTNTKARGKGFGLCLIRMLVDDYRGILKIEDRVKGDYKQGARFIVMLPVVDQ